MDMSVNQKLPVPWQKLKLKGLMGGLWWTREEVVMAIYIYIYISLNIILYISVVITLAEYLSQAIKHIHTV